MRISTVLVAAIAAVAISGCAPSRPAKALPQEFLNKVIDISFASAIADECRFLDFNKPLADRTFEAELTKLAYKGYTRHDVDTAARRFKRDPSVNRRFMIMIADRKIDVYSEKSWCMAGKREQSRKSPIGRYLL